MGWRSGLEPCLQVPHSLSSAVKALGMFGDVWDPQGPGCPQTTGVSALVGGARQTPSRAQLSTPGGRNSLAAGWSLWCPTWNLLVRNVHFCGQVGFRKSPPIHVQTLVPSGWPLTSEGLRGRGAGGLRLLPAQEIHRAREVRGLSPAGVGAGPLGPPLTHLWSLSP